MLFRSLAQSEQTRLWEAEQKVFGATHADVGAYLLGLWGLPAPIVEAVALHHAPSKAVNGEYSPLTTVHVANVLEHERSGMLHDVPSPQFDDDYLKRVGVREEIPRWRAAFENMAQQGAQ